MRMNCHCLQTRTAVRVRVEIQIAPEEYFPFKCRKILERVNLGYSGNVFFGAHRL
jgi:hypothetical protein